MNEQIEKIMKNLQVSEAEAKEIYECDKAIDRGEAMPFDLDEEKAKEAKKIAKVPVQRKPTVYKFDKKERKIDDEKVQIIAEIADFIKKFDENAEIVKKEREISFILNGNSYSLTLTKHRAPKS